MKVALTHDHLMQNGGAEKVLTELQNLFPEAPTYTLLYKPEKFGGVFDGKEIRTSFLQKLPFKTKLYRLLIPFMPTATESYDVSNFDVVISSSSALSKGIIPPEHGIHFCYCHTPPRYLWTHTHEYIQSLKVPGIVKAALAPVLSYLRLWDRAAADRVDYFIANSETVKHRIKRYYGKDAVVINPPVELDQFSIASDVKDYYLIGGRLVPYKHYDVVIEAFNKMRKPLKIFGTGPQEKELRAMAGPTIEFLGRVSEESKAKLYREAKAFLNPQDEDFGITAIESMASGRPVLALREGGATETVIDHKTGLFFDEATAMEIASTVLLSEKTEFDPKAIREHALQYSANRFRREIASFVETKWEEHKRSHLGRM
jgi:glycosyltransferase involved in cell wall biosynthesis